MSDNQPNPIRKVDKRTAWISTVLSILLLICMLTIAPFSSGGFGLVYVLFLISTITAFFTISSTEYLDTVGYKIHEFEKWNEYECKYEDCYMIEEITTQSKFILHWYRGSTKVKIRSNDELEKHIKDSIKYKTCYKSKSAAMEDILATVKEYIKVHNKKPPMIKNIKYMSDPSMYTMGTLIALIENRKYDKRSLDILPNE